MPASCSRAPRRGRTDSRVTCSAQAGRSEISTLRTQGPTLRPVTCQAISPGGKYPATSGPEFTIPCSWILLRDLLEGKSRVPRPQAAAVAGAPVQIPEV
eukprot:4506038-Alexandrium_andersonii.AAC.1